MTVVAVPIRPAAEKKNASEGAVFNLSDFLIIFSGFFPFMLSARVRQWLLGVKA